MTQSVKKKKWEKLLPGGNLDQAGYSKEYHTGDWRNQIPIIDKSKCKNCLTCVGYCPEDCILVKEGKISHFDYKYCKGCGICAKECPTKAITMKEQK
ncbi:4Fe-4S binding protein [Patescibacteria group bacterium]|nr:4Fe-4S binding protein [Patescibacteria group bacterium]